MLLGACPKTAAEHLGINSWHVGMLPGQQTIPQAGCDHFALASLLSAFVVPLRVSQAGKILAAIGPSPQPMVR